MGKRIYVGFSFFEFIWMFLIRIGAVVGLIFVAPHYNENPVVILIVLIVGSLLVLIIGDDQVVVYPDHITQTTNSLWRLFFSSKGSVYQIAEIEKAYLEIPPDPSTTEVGVALVLMAVLPKNNNNLDTSRPIFLELKNGKTVQMLTDLSWDQMNKIVDTVNMLTKQSD